MHKNKAQLFLKRRSQVSFFKPHINPSFVTRYHWDDFPHCSQRPGLSARDSLSTQNLVTQNGPENLKRGAKCSGKCGECIGQQVEYCFGQRSAEKDNQLDISMSIAIVYLSSIHLSPIYYLSTIYHLSIHHLSSIHTSIIYLLSVYLDRDRETHRHRETERQRFLRNQLM